MSLTEDGKCQQTLASNELIGRFEEKMKEICSPLDIESVQSIEEMVSSSFRDKPNMPLNRWEAKVRFSLNTALFPYVSKRDVQKVESILRIFNPSLPERTLTPGFVSPAEVAFNAIQSGTDYAGAIGNKEYFFLNYHEIFERADKGSMIYIEVLAILVPSSLVRRGFCRPTVNASFGSRELPNFGSLAISNETCWRLEPESAYFGSFTPAFPLPDFTELIKADKSDYLRVNWRNGRSANVSCCGRPTYEGCMLAVKRAAVRLPNNMKLAWIIYVNGKPGAIVDLHNHQLL